MVRLYLSAFKTILIKTQWAFNRLMRIEISTSSKMMQSINMLVSERKKLNIMFEKIYNFRPLCPQARHRFYAGSWQMSSQGGWSVSPVAQSNFSHLVKFSKRGVILILSKTHFRY